MKTNHILKILEYMKVPYDSIECTGEWVNCSCPLASATHSKGTDNNPSFGIQTNADGLSFYRCFTCGSGTLSGLIHRYNFAVGYNPALNAFYMDSQYAIDLEDIATYKDKFIFREVPEDLPVPYDYRHKYPLLENALGTGPADIRGWLKRRGIRLDVAYKYKTRYDKYGNIVFPIIDKHGEIYSMQFRSIHDKAFWYLENKELNKKYSGYQHWYGEQFADDVSALLVESQTDVLRLKSLGIPGTILASCGGVSHAQLETLTAPTLYLGYDADKAGWANQKKTIRKMHSSALNIWVLDWGVAGIGDAGELVTASQYDKVFNAKINVKGGIHVSMNSSTPLYKDKFAR